jgi:hypothetical protein
MFRLLGVEERSEKQGHQNALLQGLPTSKQELCIPQEKMPEAFKWLSFILF